MKRKEKIIGSIIILIVFILFLLAGYMKNNSNSYAEKDIFVENQSIQKKESEASLDKSIKVEIKGEIKKPGVYELQYGSRVEDLILKAGGYTDNAEKDSMVSMAKKLRDEECIIVRSKQEVQQNNLQISKSISGINAEGKVNINTASKEELKTVPGIGDVTAQKIIEFREKNGFFNAIEDLKKIDRIGDKTINSIKDKIDIK